MRKILRIAVRHRRPGRASESFATGAYFTDTVTQNNLTFRTGSASLAYGFCPGLSTDCSGAPDPHDLSTFPDATIGPGLTNADCLVIENTGVYALNLTGGIATYSQSIGGMNPPSWSRPRPRTVVRSGLRSRDLQLAEPAQRVQRGPAAFGSLAPDAKIYVIWSNSWNSAATRTRSRTSGSWSTRS